MARFKSKLLKVLGWSAVFGLGIYLTAANVAINTRILRSAINTWEDGQVEYAWGVSPLPGVVFLRHFYIAHEDRNVRWNLHLNWVRTAVSLSDLVSSRFHTYWVVADEGRFLFLEKQRLHSENPGLTLLPQVSPPKKDHSLQPSSGPAKKWGLHLAGVRVRNLSEAWVNQSRVLGRLDITGRVEVIPHKSVEVGPAEVKFTSAETFLGKKPIGTNLEGSIRYKMDPFHPDAADPEVFRSISMDGGLRLNANHLEPLNIFFRKASWLGLSDTNADIRLKVSMRNGVLEPGTEVSLADAALSVKMGPYRIRGNANLEMKIEGEGPLRAMHLRSKLQNLSLKGKDREPAVQGGVLEIHGSTTGLSMVEELFSPMKIGVVLKGPVPSLRRMNHLFPEDSAFHFERGDAMVRVEFHADSSFPAKDFGLVEMNADNGAVDVRGMQLEGRLEAKFPFLDSNLEEGLFRIKKGRVSLIGTRRQWVSTVEIPELEAQLSGNLRIAGEVHARATDSLPFIEYAEKRGLSGLVGALLHVENIRSEGHFEMRPKNVTVRNFVLDSSSLSVRGDYEGFGSLKKARFLVVKEPFALGVELVPGRDTRIILNDAYQWYGNASAE